MNVEARQTQGHYIIISTLLCYKLDSMQDAMA
jgi:hypothetical protein